MLKILPFARFALAIDVVVAEKVVAIVTGDLVADLHVSKDSHTRHVLTSRDKLCVCE